MPLRLVTFPLLFVSNIYFNGAIFGNYPFFLKSPDSILTLYFPVVENKDFLLLSGAQGKLHTHFSQRPETSRQTTLKALKR